MSCPDPGTGSIAGKWMHHPDPRRLPLLACLLSLGGCVAPYAVELNTAHFPPSRAARIVKTEPATSCITVGTFRGRESQSCPIGESYCALRKLARQHGADTVWIESVDQTYYEGAWQPINGRLVHLRPFTTTTDSGKLLRCQSTGVSP
jgi:hypothetical protein